MTRSPVAVFTVYAAGFLQGCAFVLIPALGRVLEGPAYGLSHGAYGTLFLPMTGGAIVAALAAGPLNARLGANGVFRLGLVGNTLALALLAGSALFAGSSIAYGMLLAETALLGLGFGFNLATINHFAATLFPQNETAAVTLLNGVIGGATAVSPLILHPLEALHRWWLWPIALGLGFTLALILSLRLQRPAARPGRDGEATPRLPVMLFAAAVLVYAICEGSFGSWADIYLSVDHPFPARYGAWALSAFWGAMTLFRLGLGMVPERWLPPRLLYQLSPVTMAACFLALPLTASPVGLVGAFAAAGAACSIYYPYSMSFALEAFPGGGTRVAGLLVAALMMGEGIGSYALGPLQNWFSLGRIYGYSALWGLPLLAAAHYLGRYGAGGVQRRKGRRAVTDHA